MDNNELENFVRIHWDTHNSALLNNFNSYRLNEVLTDVTLACEGYFFPAHKVVLNMCSGYFARAIQASIGKPMTFFIVGIRKEILELMLNFIYNGTATLLSTDVDELARAGKMLDIPELAQLLISVPNIKEELNKICDDGKNIANSDAGSILDAPLEPTFIEDIPITEPPIEDTPLEPINESSFSSGLACKAKSNEVSRCSDLLEDSDSANSEPYEFEGWEPENNGIAEHIKSDNGLSSQHAKKHEHRCYKCNKSFPRKYAYLVHFMQTHSPKAASYSCNFCSKAFRSQRNLEKHCRTLGHISGQFVSDKKKRSVSEQGNRDSQTSKKSSESEVLEDEVDIMLPSEHEKAPSFLQIPDLNVKVTEEDGISLTNGPAQNSLSLDDVLKEVSSAFQSHFLDYDYDEEFSNLEPEMFPSVMTNYRKCDICDISFTNTKAYYKHRSENCSILECPFCFSNYHLTDIENFNSHKESHQRDEKPYTCPYCEYASDRLRSRDDHLQKKHLGTGLFKCPVCNYEANRGSDIKKHARIKHSIEVLA